MRIIFYLQLMVRILVYSRSNLFFRSYLLFDNELELQCFDPDVSLPRYVRVNTLKLDVDSALLELSKKYTVWA